VGLEPNVWGPVHRIWYDFRVEYNNEHGASGTYHNGEPHQHRFSHAEPDDYGTQYHFYPAEEPDSDE
jgi:hypothetical protein